MECCKASQFSNDAGARIWQAADVGYLALRYGAWLTVTDNEILHFWNFSKVENQPKLIVNVF